MSQAVRYIVAFGVAGATALLLTPLAARLAQRLRLIDHPKDGRFHREPIPYLGGLAVAGALLLVGGLAAGPSGQLLTILLSALAVGGMGLADDWKTVSPFAKLAVETAAGLSLWLVGVRAGFFGIEWLDLVVTVVWVVAVTNALNLLDNMDGLAAGVSAIAALAFFVIAASRDDYLVASFSLALSGASLGFLRYNFPPARIFLGDAGSLMLGFLLAAVALKLDLLGENVFVRAAVPALILGVPLLDTVLVVLARMRDRRPVYLGGTDHASHRLVHVGMSIRRVALATYAAESVCCVTALALTRLGPDVAVWVVISAASVLLLILGMLLTVHIDPMRAGSMAMREVRGRA